MTDFVRVHSLQPILHLEINRPDQRNALTVELMERLARELEQVKGNDEIRAAVIRSAGSVFCAGMDLKSVDLFQADEAERFSLALARLYRSLLTSPIPLICAVQGPVLGGGVGIALSADVVVGGDSATFSFSETRLGLVPALVSVPASRRLTAAGLRRLTLSAETVDRDAALGLGLVDAAVSGDPTIEALNRAERMIHDQSGEALRRTRTFLLSTENARLDLELEAARLEFLASVETPAAKRGIEAFRRRERTDWSEAEG